jgi:hypothetical protein
MTAVASVTLDAAIFEITGAEAPPQVVPEGVIV